MDGNKAIAQILKAEGVEWLAAFPHQDLIEAAAQEGIRPIICRHERTGVNMADGFSRVANGRRLGVFTMQLGPGAENALGGVAQAYADSIPILLLPGGQARNRTQVHPNFEAVENYRGITKWAANINQVERIPELMRRAFTQLKSGRPGPVLLEIPTDVGTAEFPQTALDYQPVTPFKSAADPDGVRELVTALLQAQAPVINAGQGILWAEASAELTELAELIQVPVMTTLAGKSAFAEDHPLALGTGSHTSTPMVEHYLKQADFVLGAGTSFTISAFNAPMPAGIPLAQLTNCPEDINKDYPISYGGIGDAKIVLRQLIEAVKTQLGPEGRPGNTAEQIAQIKAQFRQQWRPKLTSDEVPINPYRVFVELARAVDVANTIITHDSGYPRDQLVPFWQTTTPRGYLGWGKSTQLGYGLGLALGAKLAAPDKQVINIMGDAAFGMAGMDLETAVRAQIPILTVVLNNGVMTHYASHMPYASEHWGSDQLGGNYAQVGQALGTWAERVESPDQLADAISRALAANQEGQPALLEVMTKAEEDVPKFW